MRFETLSKIHIDQLYKFEFENRRFFESIITPRDNAFYSKQGLYNHIQHQLNNMKAGISVCGVLVKNDEIVARGNLTDISSSNAMVGYRVSQNFTSKGYASLCLSELINRALDHEINMLRANVLENNPASKHILEKQGFKEIEIIPNFLTLNNQTLTCTVLQKRC